MRPAIKKSLFRSLLIIVTCCPGINPASAAVSPWCNEPGDPNYPLSFEAMASGALLPPEVRKSKTKAVQAIIDAFERQQEELVRSGVARPDDPDLEAFRNVLNRQSGGENLTNHFQYTEGDDGDILIWPSEQRQVTFNCETELPARLVSEDPQKASIGYTAHLVFIILSEQLQLFDALYSRRVEERANEYLNYLTDGLPMWPWELAVNGWGQDYSDLFEGAPRWQWVVARPSAGFEVVWPDRKDAALEASIGIEPLGFVRYTGQGHKNWWGLSALVTLGTDDNGAGVGGLIRYNNYSLGIVEREDIDDTYFFFSFDLYDKLEDTEDRIAAAKEKINQLETNWNPD